MDGEYNFGPTKRAGSKRKRPLYSLKAVGLSLLTILFCFVPPCSAFWGGGPYRHGGGNICFQFGFRRLEQDLCFSEAKQRQSASGQGA